ncbi:MAG: hypothetical protein HY098_02285 [Nitrospinae bacterium]|nr:hypothetical protein [Nitrospinota bacterium]
MIWQIPSVGSTIAGAALVAAGNLGEQDNCEMFGGMILFFAFLLLMSLTIGLWKYRLFQSACLPFPLPVPPFQQPPSASLFLQATMCITTAGLFLLSIDKICPSLFAGRFFCLPLLTIVIGIIATCVIELLFRKARDKIDIERGKEALILPANP